MVHRLCTDRLTSALHLSVQTSAYVLSSLQAIQTVDMNGCRYGPSSTAVDLTPHIEKLLAEDK